MKTLLETEFVQSMVSERPMGMFEALDSAAFPGMFYNGHRV